MLVNSDFLCPAPERPTPTYISSTWDCAWHAPGAPQALLEDRVPAVLRAVLTGTASGITRGPYETI